MAGLAARHNRPDARPDVLPLLVGIMIGRVVAVRISRLDGTEEILTMTLRTERFVFTTIFQLVHG